MRQLRQLIQHSSAAPFFQRKFDTLGGGANLSLKDFTAKMPIMTLEELVAERLRSGDPYSSRWAREHAPLVVVQLEYDTEAPLYVGLGPDELRGYAEALRRCWSLLGLGSGDRVGIFDYGTSPISYLASAAFTPYLQRGAADALGCLPVCNDGGANMSQRAVEIVKLVRPRVLFLRSDCLHPFAAEVERQSLRLSDSINALVAAENEGMLSEADRDAYQKSLAVPIYRLLRIDAAMFLAIECPRCRFLHSWPDLYFAETVPEGSEAAEYGEKGSLVITNRFAKSCPVIRYLSHVRGTLQPSGCSAGPKDLRIAV